MEANVDVDARARASKAVSHMREAAQSMIDRLQFDVQFAGDVIAALNREQTVSEGMRGLDMPGVRLGLTEAISRLESARLEARRHLFRAMVDEGLSIGDVARTWGISRQLASRILREAG